MDNFDLIFKKEKVSEAHELLESIRRDIAEVDEELYQSVMSISNARGFEEVSRDSDYIDMSQPEKLMIQCREEGDKTLSVLDTFTSAAQDFSNEKNVTPEQVQARLSNINTTTTQLIPEEEMASTEPLLYGPPNPLPEEEMTSTEPLIYGPPNPLPEERNFITREPLLYGPPNPMPEEKIMVTREPLLYGPPNPMPTPSPDPTPVVEDPAPILSTPIPEPTPTPVVSTVSPTPTVSEYAAIPDTGVEFTSQPSHVTPAAMAGAIAGIVGSSIGIKGKTEKYESKRKKENDEEKRD